MRLLGIIALGATSGCTQTVAELQAPPQVTPQFDCRVEFKDGGVLDACDLGGT